MNAVSWLASPERKSLQIKSDYALRFVPDSGRNELMPCGVAISFDLTALSAEVIDKLIPMTGLASFVEINFHINRLLLHRRKASLGEASLPMFVQDVAGDLRRAGVTSLGMAVLIDYLRTNQRNSWFPEWEEIDMARSRIEAQLLKFRSELIQAKNNAL